MVATESPQLYYPFSVPTPRDNEQLNRERLVSAAPVEDDSSFELKLRPQRLGEFIGQKKVKEQLAKTCRKLPAKDSGRANCETVFSSDNPAS